MQLPLAPSEPTVKVSIPLRSKIPYDYDNLEWITDLPFDTTISSLFLMLSTSVPESHFSPYHISRYNVSQPLNNESKIPIPQQIHNLTVVSGPSSFSSHLINISHPFISFLHTPLSSNPVVATLIPNPTCSDTILLCFDNDLTLTFHRTVRMPDNGDDQIHDLPASCGAFRLWNATEWAERLPAGMQEGVLMPMWRREAMWIAFSADGERSYKLRVMVGGVNAVSGGVVTDGENEQGKQDQQDYVVVPGQPWIDGIAVEPGVVRQFVAMPLGSGYTVEGQVTGKEKKGGFQIEIIPSYPHASPGIVWVVGTDGERKELELEKTPEEQGCKEGDVVYWQTPLTFREANLRDFLTEEEAESEAEVGVLKLEAEYDPRSFEPSSRIRRRARHYFCDIEPEEDDTEMEAEQAMELEEDSFLVGNYSPPFRATSEEPSECPAPSGLSNAPPVGFSPNMTPVSPVYEAPEEFEQVIHDRRQYRRGPVKAQPAATPSAKPAKPANIKALGLAAGGKLHQVINPDPHPPYIWDNARKCTVNIHILSPENFEEVTGIVAPGCPITMEEYVRAGIPVYEMAEEVVGGVGTGEVLGQVKSVGSMDKVMLDRDDAAQGLADEDTAGPRRCRRCEERLCDSVVRPCNHQFCWECITKEKGEEEVLRRCLQEGCRVVPIRVARFAAPMNVPGKEMKEVNVPVVKLTLNGGKPMAVAV